MTERERRRARLRLVVNAFKGQARRSQWTGYVYDAGSIELHTLDCQRYRSAEAVGAANLAGTLRQVFNHLGDEFVNDGAVPMPEFHGCLAAPVVSTAAPGYIRHI